MAGRTQFRHHYASIKFYYIRNQILGNNFLWVYKSDLNLSEGTYRQQSECLDEALIIKDTILVGLNTPICGFIMHQHESMRLTH